MYRSVAKARGTTVPQCTDIILYLYMFSTLLLTPRNLVLTAGFIAQTETGRRKSGKTRFDLLQIRSSTHLLLDLQGLGSI